MLGDAKLASTMADKLLEEGVYVIGFSYPVVPKVRPPFPRPPPPPPSNHHTSMRIPHDV